MRKTKWTPLHESLRKLEVDGLPLRVISSDKKVLENAQTTVSNFTKRFGSPPFFETRAGNENELYIYKTSVQSERSKSQSQKATIGKKWLPLFEICEIMKFGESHFVETTEPDNARKAIEGYLSNRDKDWKMIYSPAQGGLFIRKVSAS